MNTAAPSPDAVETGFLDQAEASCRSRGASLTPIRRLVLALLLRHPRG
jgi:Fe2+ or Zn2+ uptake regulation protein